MNQWLLFAVVAGALVLLVIIGLGLYFVFRGKGCPDCAEGDKCYEGECVPATRCTPGCKKEEICINGVCEKESSLTPCSVDTDCPEGGFHCTKGYCLETCLNDASCPGSQACVKGLCKLKMCRDSGECAPNEGCLPAENGHSYCRGALTCTSDSPCPQGLVCNEGVCKECLNSSECPSKNCNLGRCVTCSRFKEVPPFPCTNGKVTCSPAGTCCPSEEFSKKCSSDEDCPETNPYCLPTKDSGVCVCDKFPDGAGCSSNQQCQSGKCREVCFSGECFDFRQCGPGEYCRNQICSKEILGSSCILEASDPCLRGGNYCVNNLCQSTPGTYGSACRNDKDCAGGYSCKPLQGEAFLICQPK